MPDCTCFRKPLPEDYWKQAYMEGGSQDLQASLSKWVGAYDFRGVCG